MKIAVDGPAGAGKSTVAKIVAEKMDLLYIDTGAMYRAVTFDLIKKHISLNDESGVERYLKNLDLSMKRNRSTGEMDIFINGTKVNDHLRTKIVDQNVSLVSSYRCVRELCVDLQKKLGEEYDVILDGRDIGTVVFPDADIKFYIDASVEERARRRKDDKKHQDTRPMEEIKQDIIRRDEFDSNRKLSPLKKADDAIYLDTSEMNIEQVVDFIMARIRNL
ncbi:MAG: (d)CMP kinase, partial [Spirochaetes bacterium]|nr:(d)CMP kinase [Spirochaetota bacterium]